MVKRLKYVVAGGTGKKKRKYVAPYQLLIIGWWIFAMPMCGGCRVHLTSTRLQ